MDIFTMTQDTKHKFGNLPPRMELEYVIKCWSDDNGVEMYLRGAKLVKGVKRADRYKRFAEAYERINKLQTRKPAAQGWGLRVAHEWFIIPGYVNAPYTPPLMEYKS